MAGSAPGRLAAVANRFTIDAMWIRAVSTPERPDHGDAMPLPGFGEAQAPFAGPPLGFVAIEGGRAEDAPSKRDRPVLRVVKDEDE